jgi:hypothetical protein
MPICGPPRRQSPDEKRDGDNEYERRGTANVFCAVEPKAGRHFTFATPDRSGFEFAQVAGHPGDGLPEAETIHLVVDNLNIHRRKALADVFGAEMATEVWDRFTVHYTPTHGQLAESGGDRNRNLLAAMPGASTHPRSQNSTPRSESLEPANEPRSCQDRLEVRP